MATPLPKLKRGSFPSLIDTETANKLIQAVEDLRNLTIQPQGAGKMVAADSGVTINLSGFADILRKQLQAEAGKDGRVDAVIAALNSIIRAINNASISATCTPGGNIIVTLTVPGMPAPI